jgi:penicillin amidase
MQRWLKVTIGIISTLIIVLSIGGFIVYKLLASSLPDYSGEINVKGINGDIRIYRDSLAVPYIIAKSNTDAAFALGYVHAQDRLFTMDLIRRAGEGRLSEIIGSKTIPFDKMFRTIGIRLIASKIFSQIDPTSKELLQAYSAGVNFYIKQAKGNYPVEFDVLGYDPEPWSPEDCIIISRMMAWELNISWWVKFSCIDLIKKIGYNNVKDIIPPFAENMPGIISGEYTDPSILIKHLQLNSTALMETDKAFRNFIGWTGTHIGSNNWVVNGNLSTSGKPIIANDTHLALSAPGRWYVAVIKTNDLSVTGFTLPGAPGIIIGENKNIAWALTNIMEDDADFYSEKIDSSGKKYFCNGSWNNLDLREETIKVKNSASISFEIKSSGHGPIVSNIHPYSLIHKNENKNDAVISMKWLGNYISNEILTFYKINNAENWSDFKNAFKTYSLPGQNFVYADKYGNIGYYFGARLPLRESNFPPFIYDGTSDKNDWKDFLPDNEIPQLFNPSQNFIASANNKTAQDFKYYISNLWEPSSRIERITQLLNSKPSHSVKDFENYQNDFISPYAAKIIVHILNAFNQIHITNENLKIALKLFKNWDFKIGQYSQTAAIYSMFFKHLMYNLFYDKMGSDLYNEYVFVQNIPFRSILQLLDNPQNSWLDNLDLKQKDKRNFIIRKSLSDALYELEQKYGTNPADWQWGRLHHVLFKHFFSGLSPFIDKLVNIGQFEIGGDGTTIFNTEYPFTVDEEVYPQLRHKEFENNLGPVMRYIYDFAKPDEINFVLTTGESGNVMSSHYSDMTNFWRSGKYYKIRTDLNSISSPSNKLLILKAQ